MDWPTVVSHFIDQIPTILGAIGLLVTGYYAYRLTTTINQVKANTDGITTKLETVTAQANFSAGQAAGPAAPNPNAGPIVPPPPPPAAP